MPAKRRSKKPQLLVRTTLITQEIDDALNEEAASRSWGKSKLIRYILTNWLNFYLAQQRKIKVPAADREA